MKRSVLILTALCLPLQVHSQGFISFNNYLTGGSPFAPVYGPEVNNPQQQKWGNAADAYPAGTQTYSGAPLAGPNYSAEGWYSLTPVSDVYALNSAASPAPGSLTRFNVAGGIFESSSFLPESIYDNGTFGVYLQVRAWDNANGQYGSWTAAWDAAVAGSGKAVGWSKVFWQPVPMGAPPPAGLYNFGAHLDTAPKACRRRNTLKGGHHTGSRRFGVHPLGCSSWLVVVSRCAHNFESFNIFVVPEPSTFTLLGLGGLALLLFRRRNRA